jgi:hypothetical protein
MYWTPDFDQDLAAFNWTREGSAAAGAGVMDDYEQRSK